MRPARPRVLVSGVVLGQPMGGVRRHNAELLPRAARLLAAGGGGLAVLEGSTGIAFPLPAEVTRIPGRVPAGPPLSRALAEGRALRAAIAHAAPAFDLVHTAHLPAPRRLGLPYCLTLHDLRSLEPGSAPLVRRLLGRSAVRRAVAGAAVVCAVSETVRSRLTTLGARRTFLVPNAGDHLEALPRSPAADAPLLHVGHIEPRKNLELVIRALALDPALPALELVGAPKAGEERRLARLAEELGVGERVRFLGPLPDLELPACYARAAAVVLPSRLEGFGIGVLEAQRAHVPLAVADAGALPEVAGPATPRFDPDDPVSCAVALQRALEVGPAELEAAAARAAGYSWDASAELLVEAWTAAARG